MPQFHNQWAVILGALLALSTLLAPPPRRSLLLTLAAYTLGYVSFNLLAPILNATAGGSGPGLVASRLGLTTVALSLILAAIATGTKPIDFALLGDLRAPLSFPLIWAGPGRAPVWVHTLIGILVTSVSFAPATAWGELTGRVVLLALLFSLANSLLEEIIFRGLLLSRLTEAVGERWSLLLTSLAFGFYHYTFPLGDGVYGPVGSLGFALLGGLLGGLTLRSGGLAAAWAIHAVANVWMVLSGLLPV